MTPFRPPTARSRPSVRFTRRTVRNALPIVSAGRVARSLSAQFSPLPYSAAGEARAPRLSLLPLQATRRGWSKGPGGGLESTMDLRGLFAQRIEAGQSVDRAEADLVASHPGLSEE